MAKNKILTTLFSIVVASLTYTSAHAVLPVTTGAASATDADGGYLKVSYTRKTVDQIKFKLEKRGYKKIRIIDNESPIYILQACRDGEKYKFAIRDDGQIQNREQVGHCARKYREADRDYDDRPARRYDDERRSSGYNDYDVSPSEIIRILGNHGYGRVYFTDRNPPVYQLSACRGDVKYNVYVSSGGRIQNAQKVGYCSTGSRYLDFWKSGKKFR